MTNMTIKKDDWYTLGDLMKMNAFPWLKPKYMMYTPFVNETKNKEILKPFTRGGDVGLAGKRYHFKGVNVLALISKIEEGNH